MVIFIKFVILKKNNVLSFRLIKKIIPFSIDFVQSHQIE